MFDDCEEQQRYYDEKQNYYEQQRCYDDIYEQQCKAEAEERELIERIREDARRDAYLDAYEIEKAEKSSEEIEPKPILMSSGDIYSDLPFVVKCIIFVLTHIPSFFIAGAAYECKDDKTVFAACIVYFVVFLFTRVKVLSKLFHYGNICAWWLSIAYQCFGMCMINGIDRVSSSKTFIYNKEEFWLTLVCSILTAIPIIIQVIKMIINKNSDYENNFECSDDKID